MICDICHSREARVIYTEIINGQKREQHLCENCAGEQTRAITEKLGNEINIGSILSGILQNYAKGLAAKSSNEPVCQRCGMTASKLIKDGRLGCPECYNAFSMILEKNLKTVQGGVEYHGKVPVNAIKVDIAPAASAGKTAADVMKAATDEIVRRNTRRKRPSKKAGADEYRELLQKALEEEDYEEAARLRDLIKEAAEVPEGKKAAATGKKAAAEGKKTASAGKKAATVEKKAAAAGKKSVSAGKKAAADGKKSASEKAPVKGGRNR